MDKFLKTAYNEAQKGLREGGIPIGAVLVKDGQVIATGYNKRVQDNDPMTHAEIDCLRNAGRIGNYKDTVLYSTLMPCYMCAGAVVQFKINKVVVGEAVNFPGAPDFMREHGVEVVNQNDPDCINMMDEFIKNSPGLWFEDIGE